MTSNGFSLLELLVAAVLAGVILTLGAKSLLRGGRAVRQGMDQVESHSVLRTAAVIMPKEVGHAVALSVVSPSSVEYGAVRAVHFVCRPWNGGPVVVTRRSIGQRRANASTDSLLVLVAAGASSRWWRTDLLGAGDAGPCVDGSPATHLTLSPPPNPPRVRLPVGTPVLGFDLSELRGYRDRRGRWWIGYRRRSKATGWPAIQPLLGPLAPGGVEFSVVPGAEGRARGLRVDLRTRTSGQFVQLTVPLS